MHDHTLLEFVLLVSFAGLAVGLINIGMGLKIMAEQDDLAAGEAAELQASADVLAELSTISGELTTASNELTAALAAGDATALKAAAEKAAKDLTANAAKVEAAVAAAKAADPTKAPPAPPAPANPITVDVSGVPTTGTVGSAFTGSVQATGGSGPLNFSIDSGALPDGLSMAAGGAISGSPGTAGSFTADVAVTDANGDKGTGTIAITVAAAAAPAA